MCLNVEKKKTHTQNGSLNIEFAFFHKKKTFSHRISQHFIPVNSKESSKQNQ